MFTWLAVRTRLLWKIPPDGAFKAFNSPFCISSAVMGFLRITLSWKDLNMKESRELLPKSIIPFLLQTFFSLSYLLHNSMSQDLFGEASKRRNKKQEGGKKVEQEKLEGKSLNIWDLGFEDAPPPSIYFSLAENTFSICVCLELNQPVEFSCRHI